MTSAAVTAENIEKLTAAPLANSQSISSLYSDRDALNEAELKKLGIQTTAANERPNEELLLNKSEQQQQADEKESSNSVRNTIKSVKSRFEKKQKTGKTSSRKMSSTGNHSNELEAACGSNHLNKSSGGIHRRHFSITGSLISQHQREQWSKKFDFLMSIIGFSVDLASIWRFPYLCFKNGGGAFLIPYTIMIFLLGLPLFFMELALGQYNKCGAITCWKKICPLLSGVGYAVVLIAFYTDFFYNVIISWGVYYLYDSFSKRLPWGNCDNEWNTDYCYPISESESNDNKSQLNKWLQLRNNSAENITRRQVFVNQTNPDLLISSSEEYFLYRMYEINDHLGMDDFGHILRGNVICLFVIYVVCYFSMWKGVKTSGKVVWVTALLPYVVLIILAVRALFLSGSIRGLEYYITPNITRLQNSEVWTDAASQVFFSLGPGFGVLLAFSSYNKFDNNIYKDAIITVFVNYLSSFVSGAVIFMYLGYMSEVTNKNITEVAKEGSSLVFIVYPEAISILPIPQFWSVIFFLMLITLGLDSSVIEYIKIILKKKFGGSEAIITALADEYPILRRRREIFVGVLFSFYMIIGLPSCTQAGYYLVEFLNNYSVSHSILFAVLIETIAVAWLYGTKRFCDDVYEMINYYPGRFWCYCWKYITPVCIAIIFCFGIYTSVQKSLDIPRTGGVYHYPTWSHVTGWLIAASSCICIPIVAIYRLLTAKGTFMQRLKETIKPRRDQNSLENRIKIELEQQLQQEQQEQHA